MKARFSDLVGIFLLVTVLAIIHPLKRDAEMSPKASGGRQMPSYIRKPSLYGGTSTLIQLYTLSVLYTGALQQSYKYTL